MAQLKRNTADGGTSGTDVSVANSGGASGDAFDVVATHTNFEYLTDVTLSPQGGPAYIANNCVGYVQWTVTASEFWGSVYWRFWPVTGAGSNPVTEIIKAYGTSDADAATINVNINTGKVGVQTTNAGDLVLTSAASPTSDQWMRIDWHFKIASSGGVAEARVYFDAVGAPSTFETITAGGTNTVGGMGKLRIGLTNAPDATRWMFWDDIIVDDAAWVDRSGVVFTGRPRPQSNIYRM